MPTINLYKKKSKPVTFNKSYYQDIYQDSRWRSLRDYKLRLNPLCEACEARGLVVLTDEVHHIIPFIYGKNRVQVEELAFDLDNLQCLCVSCHKEAHIKLKEKL